MTRDVQTLLGVHAFQRFCTTWFSRLFALDLVVQRFPTGSENISGNDVDILAFIARRFIKHGFPFREGLVRMSHGHQSDCGDVILHWKGWFLKIVGEGVIGVIKGEQALADVSAILRVKRAHAADDIGIKPAFNLAVGNDRHPVGKPLKLRIRLQTVSTGALMMALA